MSAADPAFPGQRQCGQFKAFLRSCVIPQSGRALPGFPHDPQPVAEHECRQPVVIAVDKVRVDIALGVPVRYERKVVLDGGINPADPTVPSLLMVNQAGYTSKAVTIAPGAPLKPSLPRDMGMISSPRPLKAASTVSNSSSVRGISKPNLSSQSLRMTAPFSHSRVSPHSWLAHHRLPWAVVSISS